MNRTVPGRNTIPRSVLKSPNSTVPASSLLVTSLIPAEVGLFGGIGRRSPRYRLNLGWLAVVAGDECLCVCVGAGPQGTACISAALQWGPAMNPSAPALPQAQHISFLGPSSLVWLGLRFQQ